MSRRFFAWADWDRNCRHGGLRSSGAGNAGCHNLRRGGGSGSLLSVVRQRRSKRLRCPRTGICARVGDHAHRLSTKAEPRYRGTARGPTSLASSGQSGRGRGVQCAVCKLEANPAFLLAMAAALSEAAADTVSSELGQALGRTPRLITTWRPVPAGTDGGVSLGWNACRRFLPRRW